MEKNREAAAAQEPRQPKAGAEGRRNELEYRQEIAASMQPKGKSMDEHPAVLEAKRRIAEKEARESVENARVLLDRMADEDVSFFHEAVLNDQSGRLKELKKALGTAQSEKLSTPHEGVKFLERFLRKMSSSKDASAAEDSATVRIRLEKAISALPPAHRTDALMALRDYAERRKPRTATPRG